MKARSSCKKESGVDIVEKLECRNSRTSRLRTSMPLSTDMESKGIVEGETEERGHTRKRPHKKEATHRLCSESFHLTLYLLHKYIIHLHLLLRGAQNERMGCHTVKRCSAPQ